MEESRQKKNKNKIKRLSPRELEILNYWVRRYSRKRIAKELGISYSAVAGILLNATKKLGFPKHFLRHVWYEFT